MRPGNDRSSEVDRDTSAFLIVILLKGTNDRDWRVEGAKFRDLKVRVRCGPPQ